MDNAEILHFKFDSYKIWMQKFCRAIFPLNSLKHKQQIDNAEILHFNFENTKRVWKGIFGIRDLTKIRCGNRENDKYIDGIRDLTVPREPGLAQKLGTGCGIYVCVSVGNGGNRHDPLVLAAKAN